MTSSTASHRRSLVRDACGCLRQQMFFWGCDVRHRDENLLVRVGMKRLARGVSHAEGSSRYRMNWRKGIIELHSFCAGWYPQSGEGVVFIRRREHLSSCAGGVPLTPGTHGEKRLTISTTDSMLQTCRPLLEWVAEYESWVQAHTARGYREKCWMKLLARMGGRPWLPPVEAERWRACFLANPDTAPRAKRILREKTALRCPVRRAASGRGTFPTRR